MEIKIGDKIIGKNRPVYIIAEAGSNHDGKLEQAKKLIDAAAEAGADAVKFQLFRAAKIYPPNAGKIPMPQGKKLDLYEFFKQVELPFKWLPILKKYSENKGLAFIVTPFDEKAVDELEKAGIGAYKIASPELNHLPLLKHIAEKQKPIIASTGLCKLRDIDEAVDIINSQGNDRVILLHCVTGYPAKPEEYNLRVIGTLTRAFQAPVGISDHSLDSVLVPKLAVAAGAAVVEKHFTINKKLPGADHSFALEPQELKLMVDEIRKVEKWNDGLKERFINSRPLYKKIMGDGRKTITASEAELYPGDKRSIFTIKDINKGEKLTKNNVAVLRAERYLKPGIHPRYFEIILGAKAVKPIKMFTGLQWHSLLNK